MNKINYQKEFEKIVNTFNGHKPNLLLHSCCAPCSSYVLEYLSNFFNITVFFYNPNINVETEYQKRKEEQKRFIKEFSNNEISFIEGDYDIQEFYTAIKGDELKGEGSIRCKKCYTFRLEKTAILAKEKKYDYFCTTLSISPLKNSQIINKIGLTLEEKYQIPWLKSDFKKKNGYKRSIELSCEYSLYRQNYCGCSFSKIESENKNREN
ncbi:MAG: epoxyqueuosine reductase [Fusobacteriaceae bacterium]|jgi:hypothetical protein|nr:epoxyqueuosine reductase [Fusobacteriaceae bacterium]